LPTSRKKKRKQVIEAYKAIAPAHERVIVNGHEEGGEVIKKKLPEGVDWQARAAMRNANR